MSGVAITLGGVPMVARAAGTLWLPESETLVVSDLHLGKSERIARRGGTLLPPYDTTETLDRLGAEIAAVDPARVICLGDSFDDLAAARALTETTTTRLATLQAGRAWDWVEGNHDAGPIALGGTHRHAVRLGPVVLRHIADPSDISPEISGHYHPKARISAGGRSIARPCFAHDGTRLILPAFGAYTGGLWTSDPAISGLFSHPAQVILTGPKALAFPMPR